MKGNHLTGHRFTTGSIIQEVCPGLIPGTGTYLSETKPHSDGVHTLIDPE